MQTGKRKENRLKTLAWALGTAWRINKRTMLFWAALSILLSVLPAIALRYNRETLSVLTAFLSGTGNYVFADIVRPTVMLGLLLTAVGLSARVSFDLIYIMMYDAYFVGMYELTMESIQRIEMTDLLKKEINDAYNYSILYAGSLVDFVCGLCTITAKAVSVIALLVVAFTSSMPIFIISLIYVAGVFVLNLISTKKMQYEHQTEFQLSRRIEYYERFSENRGMAKETRIYENTDEIVEQWAKPFTTRQESYSRRAFAGEIRDFVSGAGFYVFLIIMLGISLVGVSNGSMTPDIFLVLFTLCMNLYGAISGMAGMIYRFNEGLAGMERQRAILTYEPPAEEKADADRFDTPADENVVFKVSNLRFAYAEAPVIKDISFTVNKGETVALVGQNGSGKTTLVKLLLNMYSPQSGSIEVLGRPYGDYKRGFLRSKIGVFFQDFYLFHMTLRENVAIGGIEDIGEEERIIDAVKKGGAEKLTKTLTKGLDTLLGTFMDRSGTELSGGERQRVAASRTHMNNRDILIFDEPASMLDPIAEMEQFVNIKDLLGDRTAILISHRVGFARMADKIIMLDGGEIAETGTHDELMRKGGLYAHFFNEQAQWYEHSDAVKEEMA